MSGKTEQFLYAYYLLFFALQGILQHDWYKRGGKNGDCRDPEVLRTTEIVDGRRNHEGVNEIAKRNQCIFALCSYQHRFYTPDYDQMLIHRHETAV
ncbi:hypothetical protein [Bacillus smithii]|uniref:hypothetical protein n=1 Tax=Bacillus smithii TaxID=1479 RepID=UPI003D25BE1E